MVHRLDEPGASFFGDIGSGFDGDVVLLGKLSMVMRIDLRLLKNFRSF
jgi:hypothetical protein